jgi:hypothetical protein
MDVHDGGKGSLVLREVLEQIPTEAREHAQPDQSQDERE